jgi:hypothetical protein
MDWQLDAVARRDARIAALNTPQPPTPLQAIVGDVVDEVKEIAGKVFQVDLAKAWLIERLSDGPVPATVVQAEAAEKGWNIDAHDRLAPDA